MKSLMTKFVELFLLQLWAKIGINKPENHNTIVEFCVNDIKETAHPDDWNSEDVLIAFRRFIEQSETI